MTPRTARPYTTLYATLAWMVEGGGLPPRQVGAPTEEAALAIDAIKARLARQQAEAEEEIERIRQGERG